jgi:hypothetical protein
VFIGTNVNIRNNDIDFLDMIIDGEKGKYQTL